MKDHTKFRGGDFNRDYTEGQYMICWMLSISPEKWVYRYADKNLELYRHTDLLTCEEAEEAVVKHGFEAIDRGVYNRLKEG